MLELSVGAVVSLRSTVDVAEATAAGVKRENMVLMDSIMLKKIVVEEVEKIVFEKARVEKAEL